MRGYRIIFEQGFDKEKTQEEARKPGEDLASYLCGNLKRNEDWRGGGRQPRKDIASYLNRTSIRNKHRMQGSEKRISHHS